RRGDGGAISRFHPRARRQPGCHGCLRPVSRTRARRAASAQANRYRRVTCRLMLSSVLLAGSVAAAPAYVSDELILGVYAAPNGQGQRLSTLHSGAALDTLSVDGDSTEVRLKDGTIGWVKSSYLTRTEPAAARVKRLED